MFAYNSLLKSCWNKKIVYAPNGFGKTTNSNQLKKELEDEGKRVKLFTQKTLEDLVSSFEETFFLGPTAKLEVEKIKLRKELEKANPFVKGIKAKSMTAAASSSFVLSYYKIRKISDIPPDLVKDNKRIQNKYASYGEDDFIALDSELDYQLYCDIIDFVSKINKSDIKNETIDELAIDKEAKDNVYSLYLYSKLNGFRDCLLCGKHYHDSKSLVDHIEKHMAKLKEVDRASSLRKLNSLSSRIIMLFNNSRSAIIRNVFDNVNYNTIKRKYLLINLYLVLCNDDVLLNSIRIGNISINDDGDNTFDYISRISKINKKIDIIESTESENLKQIIEFNNFVVQEIKTIIRLDDNIEIVPEKNKKGFSFKINNKKQDASKFLSTSEFKRLVLVVLYAEIKYSKVDVLILDDPIDSYDDYTKLLAIKYIKTILSCKKLKSWYLLTNDFECASNLSFIKRCNVRFYLVNPDYVYCGAPYSYWEQECTYNEVAKIGLNDISYLISFITRKASSYPFDKDIMLCSLTVPLRNIRSEIIRELKNVNVTNSSGIDNNWIDDIKQSIESCYEHYKPDLYDFSNSSIKRSNSLMINDIAALFCRLHSSRRNVPSSYLSNSANMVGYRDLVVKRCFIRTRTNNYCDIVNYLFLKALMIENIKFIFEKKIIDKGYSSYSQIDMDNILSNANGLQSIISGIKSLYRSSPVRGIGSLITKAEKIHDDYSVIYNAVDHSTTRMISPYLSLSLKDIKVFKEEVDAL